MLPEEMKKARDEAVKNIFKKVDKVVDEAIGCGRDLYYRQH